MVDDSLHALHEVVGVPMIAVMNENPDIDDQRHPLIGILEIMSAFLNEYKIEAAANR